MSFDRYLAITKAFVSKNWMASLRSPVASYIFSITGWVLSVLLCIQLYEYSTLTACNVCGYSFPLVSKKNLLKIYILESNNFLIYNFGKKDYC